MKCVLIDVCSTSEMCVMCVAPVKSTASWWCMEYV